MSTQNVPRPAVARLVVVESAQCIGSPSLPLVRLCGFDSRGALLLQSLRRALLRGAQVEADGLPHSLELNLPASLFGYDARGDGSSLKRVLCIYRSYADCSPSPSRCSVGRRTHIAMIDSNLYINLRSTLVAKLCFVVQSKRIRLDLLGFLSSALSDGAAAGCSGRSASNSDVARSLIVVGPHGSGMADVVEGALRSITDAILGDVSNEMGGEGENGLRAANESAPSTARETARILHVRPSILSAVGKENCDCYFLHILNLACALAQSERILVLLHDVDSYLPPSSPREHNQTRSSNSSSIVKVLFQFLAKLKDLRHLQICVVGTSSSSSLRNVPFDAVVELENVTYGDKVVAARMLIDSECASSMNDDAWANRCLGAASLLKTLLSTSRPQSAGLSPFLRICQNVLRGMGSSFKVEADTKTNSAEKALGLQLSNVCGQSALKATVREALIFPRQYSSVYRSFGIQPPSGILMYGPPGTGKTLMAMEIARELCGGFFTIKLNEVVRGHVGEGERTLRTLLSDAKANAPCVVFIDEFQSIFAARGAEEGSSGSVGVSLTAALAAALDDVAAWNASAGSQSLITVLAASNEPWAIDSGFLRPGRLDRCVFVGPMDAAGVEQLFAKEFELFSFMDGAVEVDRCSVLADVGVHLAGKYTGAQLRHAMKGLKLRHVKERVKMVKEASHGEFDDLRIDIRIIFEWAQAPLKNMESSLEKYRYFESLR